MKKLWYSLKTFVYSYTVQYIFLVVGLIIFFMISGRNMMLINDEDIYKYTVIGSGIAMIPISIYLYKKYKIKESKIKVNKLLLMIPLGLSISLFYNMLTLKLQTNQVLDLNFYLVFIYVVILAPIFEELVFRYITLRKAKEMYSEKRAVILVSLVFALMHDGIISIIYAFLIGLVFCYVYKKYKNILYPMVLHISANMMSMFITEFNLIALIVSFISLIIIVFYLKKEDHI